jgi:hypothetical protein
MKLLAVGLAALAVAANPKDPQKHFTASDTRAARAIALRLSDLPPGWKQVKSNNSDDTCTAQPDESQLVETADVDPTFNSPAGPVIQINSEVQTFKTAAQARRDWAWATLSAMRSCLREELKGQFGQHAKISLFSLTPPKLPVEREKGFRMAIDATVQGQRVVAGFSLIALGQGRTTVFFSMFSLRGFTLPAIVTRAYVTVIAHRLVAHA